MSRYAGLIRKNCAWCGRAFTKLGTDVCSDKCIEARENVIAAKKLSLEDRAAYQEKHTLTSGQVYDNKFYRTQRALSLERNKSIIDQYGAGQLAEGMS
jgi:hypothetical protein